ncbi:Poly(A)-specific ribonuclease PARN [Acorus calamus]|uniref:Poly(A)-specific ribonuclease PARN n=1 Tax=Acorus calamus TaxID=4465 RepID=A0AAV9EKE0_ACOCL|nr:Poly(A)-specific ribonuclease PARN [Acorus calamus]
MSLRAIYETLTLRPHHICTALSGGRAAVKRVTRENFVAAVEELMRLVRASDFMSVDLEMTGLVSAPWREAFEFDNLGVGYLKVKDSAEWFAVVHFGVCPFWWEPSKDSFIAHPSEPSQNLFVFETHWTNKVLYLTSFVGPFNLNFYFSIHWMMKCIKSCFEDSWDEWSLLCGLWTSYAGYFCTGPHMVGSARSPPGPGSDRPKLGRSRSIPIQLGPDPLTDLLVTFPSSKKKKT